MAPWCGFVLVKFKDFWASRVQIVFESSWHKLALLLTRLFLKHNCFHTRAQLKAHPPPFSFYSRTTHTTSHTLNGLRGKAAATPRDARVGAAAGSLAPEFSSDRREGHGADARAQWHRRGDCAVHPLGRGGRPGPCRAPCLKRARAPLRSDSDPLLSPPPLHLADRRRRAPRAPRAPRFAPPWSSRVLMQPSLIPPAISYVVSTAVATSTLPGQQAAAASTSMSIWIPAAAAAVAAAAAAPAAVAAAARAVAAAASDREAPEAAP